MGQSAFFSSVTSRRGMASKWGVSSSVRCDLSCSTAAQQGQILRDQGKATMSEAGQKTAVETQKPETFAAKAYAARSATSGLAPFSFERRKPLADDVQIEILFCGVCHSDLHLSRDEWKDV